VPGDAGQPRSVTIDCTDEHVTEGLGRSLADGLTGIESGPLLVTLSGELGAGKTTLVRAILRALGYAGPVPSPTYTLLEQYEAGGWAVAHLDLYRLRGAGELEEVGVRELLAGRRLILVEWPEHAGEGLPAADLAVVMSLAPVGRTAQLRANTRVGERLLAAVFGRMPVPR
jgi:tRNA threonylcarbamoyladenosine biosynthesis protein TsaE